MLGSVWLIPARTQEGVWSGPAVARESQSSGQPEGGLFGFLHSQAVPSECGNGLKELPTQGHTGVEAEKLLLNPTRLLAETGGPPAPWPALETILSYIFGLRKIKTPEGGLASSIRVGSFPFPIRTCQEQKEATGTFAHSICC